MMKQQIVISGVGGQIMGCMCGGSGMVGQMMGNPAMRGPNMQNFGEAMSGFAGAASQAFSAGAQAFGAMSSIMQNVSTMSTTMTHQRFAGV